ncbi:hypothetical protein [Gryllotalpicola protaetiae]|nr:hypothetical protein [Gryllotalpicola protaetiae]
MQWRSATYVRDNWARVMDEAVREPIAVTSHGRTRVIIVDAALSQELTGVLADAGLRLPQAPQYPWHDPLLSMEERMRLLRERKKEITAKPLDDWTDEEIKIFYTDELYLDE